MHDIRPYIPELFSNPGTLLYIGARADAHSWLDELIRAGNKVSILEVWGENINELYLTGWLRNGRIKALIQLDVRNIEQISSRYDYVFYWHGPEHLSPSEVQPTLEKLEERTNRTLALACPWGKYSQGAYMGNPYEEHKTTLYPDFFEFLGFSITTYGKPDEPGGEIVAWKRV